MPDAVASVEQHGPEAGEHNECHFHLQIEAEYEDGDGDERHGRNWPNELSDHARGCVRPARETEQKSHRGARDAGNEQANSPLRQRAGDRRRQLAASNPGHGRAKDDADGWNIRRGQDAHHVGDLPQPNGHGDAAGAFEKAVERHTPWRVPPGINHSDASMLARR